MNMKISAAAACFMALAYYSNNLYAALPESCFQSPTDYEVYLMYGFGHPWNPYADKGMYPYPQINPGKEVIEKYERTTKNGPAKIKSISIDTKEVVVNGKPYMDASMSTTPSGEKSYFWQAVDEKSIMDSTSKFPLTPAGAEYLFNLTVSDPVCGTKVTKQLKLHIH